MRARASPAIAGRPRARTPLQDIRSHPGRKLDPAVKSEGPVSGGEERFMHRALELARSAPFTSPNPRVGAVIVRDGKVIGEGAHLGVGTPHAEAVALEAAGDARGAT